MNIIIDLQNKDKNFQLMDKMATGKNILKKFMFLVLVLNNFPLELAVLLEAQELILEIEI